MDKFSSTKIYAFQRQVWSYFETNKRSMPWRLQEPDGTYDVYKILVSEIMLQQTQVSRVINKYNEFIKIYPTVESLAHSQLGDVLRLWSGLGYNRRAKYLHDASVVLESKPLPWREDDLVMCKGIGTNTARAVLVYAYDQPQVFIETNIRTVYIHHFFPDEELIRDSEIQKLVEYTLPDANYREWYWALMDYGNYLKTKAGNASMRSKSYSPQSKFVGSRRELRGKVINLLRGQTYSYARLSKLIIDNRLREVCDSLQKEGLIKEVNGVFSLD